MAVLSHLALRFSTHPENLATEALAYVLGQSAAVRQAMCRHIAAISGRELSLQRFETQTANDDQSRPDLIGITPDSAKGAVIEVKFWAGLTEAQPIAYLSAMQHPGVLLFVAPEARLRSLWGELVRRLSEAGTRPANGVLRKSAAAPLAITSSVRRVGGHCSMRYTPRRKAQAIPRPQPISASC